MYDDWNANFHKVGHTNIIKILRRTFSDQTVQN